MRSARSKDRSICRLNAGQKPRSCIQEIATEEHNSMSGEDLRLRVLDRPFIQDSIDIQLFKPLESSVFAAKGRVCSSPAVD